MYPQEVLIRHKPATRSAHDRLVTLEPPNKILMVTLVGGLWNELQYLNGELFEKVFGSAHETTADLSNLTRSELSACHRIIKSYYDDVINGRAPRFNMVRPDDEDLNRERRKYFDLIIRLLEEDPRLAGAV